MEDLELQNDAKLFTVDPVGAVFGRVRNVFTLKQEDHLAVMRKKKQRPILTRSFNVLADPLVNIH